MSSLPAAPRRGVTPSTAFIPAADNLLCYACGAWPCVTGCRISSSSNRRTSDMNGKHSNGKHAPLPDGAEQEAWYQLEHKAPLKSFGDKAYSVSVFNHSIRADCVWNVVQRTIDGVTMLTPTGTVLSKIAIAFGREDYPYAWKTDIDGSDVLFGWIRVNGDTRYPIDPHKATRQADTDDVLQSNAVAGSLSHINVMFGSSNSYYNTKRFQGNDARAGRPTSSKKNVMTKQHLSAFHSQASHHTGSSPPRSPNNRKHGAYVFNSLLSEAIDRNAAAAAAAAAASSTSANGAAEIFYHDILDGACNHTEWISQRLSLPNSLSGAWGVVVPQLNSRPSTSASANHRFVPSPPRSPSLLPQPPLSPSLNSQNPSAKPGGMPSPHPHTRPTSSTIYGSQRMTGRAKSGKFVSGGHLRGLLDRWETHSPAHQQPHAARFSIMPRDDLDRFRRSQSGPVPYSALGTRHGSSSPPPFTSSPRLNDFSGSFDLAVRPRTQGDRPRTQQSSSSFGRPDAAQSRSRSPSPRKMNAAMGGSNGNLVANWTRDLTNELLAASEGVSKGTAVSKPFKMRSVQVPLRSIATPNHRASPDFLGPRSPPRSPQKSPH